MNSVAPETTEPPASLVSITTSSQKTSRIAAQSLVSMVRKYRAFNCFMASISVSGSAGVIGAWACRAPCCPG